MSLEQVTEAIENFLTTISNISNWSAVGDVNSMLSECEAVGRSLKVMEDVLRRRKSILEKKRIKSKERRDRERAERQAAARAAADAAALRRRETMLEKKRIREKERRDRNREARQDAAGAVPNYAMAPMSVSGDEAMMDVEGIAAGGAAGAMLDNVDPTRRSDMQYLANREAQGLSNELSDVDMLDLVLDGEFVDSFGR